MLQIVERKGMVRGDGFQVAGIEPDLAGGNGQQHRDHQAEADHQEPVIEQHAFQAIA